jgi:hypothetical protein
MDQEKQDKLKDAGWQIGDASEFLSLVFEEGQFGLIESIKAQVEVDNVDLKDRDKVHKYVRYPEDITITVKHKKGCTEWVGINVKKEHITEIVHKWKDVPIDVDNSKGNDWSKTIDGYKFKLVSLFWDS